MSAFESARARFTHLLAAQGHAPEGLNIYPQAAGDHWDRKEFAALQIGDLFAFQATDDTRIVFKALVTPEGTDVALEPALVRALTRAAAGGPPVDRAHAGLQRLVRESGTAAALEPRLRFLFDFGQWVQVCPPRPDDLRLTIRWQMSLTARGSAKPPAPELLPDDHLWITLTHEGETTRITTGTPGCG